MNSRILPSPLLRYCLLGIPKWISCIFMLSLFSSFAWASPAPQQGQGSFMELDSLFKESLSKNLNSAQQILERQALQVSKPNEKITFLLNLGELKLKVGKPDSTLVFYRMAQELAVTEATQKPVYNRLAGYFHQTHQQDSAIVYFRKAIQLLPTDAYERKGILYHNIAGVFFTLPELDSARENAKLSRTYIDQLPPEKATPLLAANASFMGNVYLYSAKYDSAYQVLLEALALYQSLDSKGGMANAYTQIGGVFQFQSQYREAIPYYLQSLDLRPKEIHAGQNLATFQNVGICYLELDSLDSAQFYFREAYSTATQIPHRPSIANAAGNLGAVFLREGQPDSATHYLEVALASFQALNYPNGICMTYVGMAEVQLAQREFPQALRNLRSAQNIATSLGAPELQKAVYKGLVDVFETTHRADSALFYYKQVATIKDSISSTEVKKEIEALKIQYNTRIQQEENKSLNLDLARSQEQQSKDRLVYISLIGFVLLGGIITALILVIRNQNRKRKLARTEIRLLAEQSRAEFIEFKLNNARKTVEEKNQLLQNLENDLKDQWKQGDLREDLYLRFNVDKDWAQLMFEFEMAYPGFFASINQKAEKLTKNDLRLAALIKLKLSNKEIAISLNISPDGVKKAKTRLKKKLGLSGEENLLHYIESA